MAIRGLCAARRGCLMDGENHLAQAGGHPRHQYAPALHAASASSWLWLLLWLLLWLPARVSWPCAKPLQAYAKITLYTAAGEGFVAHLSGFTRLGIKVDRLGNVVFMKAPVQGHAVALAQQVDADFTLELLAAYPAAAITGALILA